LAHAPLTGAPASARRLLASPPAGVSVVRALAALFALHAVGQLAEALLSDGAALAAGAGALAALFGAEKVGVRLLPDEATIKEWASELGVGAGIALAGVLAVVAAAAVLRAGISVGGGGGSLLLSVLRAALRATRDQLLLTGAAVIACAGLGRAKATPLAAALAHGAAAAGTPDATVTGAALAAAGGALAGALWLRGSGARAVGWSAAWIFASGLGLRGALLELRGISFVLQPTHRASGALAIAAAALLAGLTTAILARKQPKAAR